MRAIVEGSTRHWLVKKRSGAALALALSVTSIAVAQNTPKPVAKVAAFGYAGGALTMSVDYTSLFDAEIQQQMKNGLKTVIVLRAALYQSGQSDPVALTAKTCTIAYDIWNEVYLAAITRPGSTKNSVISVFGGVLRQCGGIEAIPIGDASSVKMGNTYYVQGLVEINPVSQDMLDRIHKWVKKPSGVADLGPSDALFGSFVGLIIARVGAADRQLAFKTQNYTVPLPPPANSSQ